MKITTINEFKKYLAENHMDFGGGSTASPEAKLPNFSITGYEWADEDEEEENPIELSGQTLLDILTTNLEISTNVDDFLDKVATHITTSGEYKLSDEDEVKLIDWYMEQNGDEEIDSSNEEIDSLIDEVVDLDMFIHDMSTTGSEISLLNTITDKYCGKYDADKYDGIPLRDRIVDAVLSSQQLKSLINELTDLKNHITT